MILFISSPLLPDILEVFLSWLETSETSLVHQAHATMHTRDIMHAQCTSKILRISMIPETSEILGYQARSTVTTVVLLITQGDLYSLTTEVQRDVPLINE